MKGKDKCNFLREIRIQTARLNGIPIDETPCPHKGECAGTCPKCDADLLALNRELARRKRQNEEMFLPSVAMPERSEK